MKFILFLNFLLPLALWGQDTTAVDYGDTTVYQIADEAPRFPSPCERYDTTATALSTCAQQFLLDYVYKRVLYPQEARENNVAGTAVLSFIVERNGFINRPEIVRDPGSGLGQAALTAVYAMQREVLWRPAIKDSTPVRFRFILPVRFKLEEPKPYVLYGSDTIYTDLTRSVEFTGNEGDITGYFSDALTYPEEYADTCIFGQMDVQLLIMPDGLVEVQDIIDYSDLGLDFTSVALDAATGSFGQWRAGEYEGRPVKSAFDVSFTFYPEDGSCETEREAYIDANRLINEGSQLAADSTTLNAGIAALTRAVNLFPMDGRFRIARGQVFLDNNRLLEACEDLSLARQLALIDWYDGVLPLICREETEEE